MASILVVDDSDDICCTLVEACQLAGHAAFSASHLAQAVDTARKHSIDIAFVDYLMPVADGRVVGKALRELGVQSVVLLSGLDEDEIRREPGEFDGLMQKPIGMEELTACINKQLSSTQGPRGK